MEAREVICKSDSQLVVGQIKEEIEVKEPLLQSYYHLWSSDTAKTEPFALPIRRRRGYAASACTTRCQTQLYGPDTTFFQDTSEETQSTPWTRRRDAVHSLDTLVHSLNPYFTENLN